jgi:hypothetical protein
VNEIRVSSILEEQFRDVLEELMFFNPQQERSRAGIVASVTHYGAPQVMVKEGQLRIGTECLQDMQTLYALDGSNDCGEQLVGAVIFVRDTPDALTILHVAVRADYSAAGEYGERCVVMRLMTEVRLAAARLKGVRNVRFFDHGGNVKTMPVRAAN